MLTAANRTARRAARSRRDTGRRAAAVAPAEREQPHGFRPHRARAGDAVATSGVHGRARLSGRAGLRASSAARGGLHDLPPVVEELKAEARERGLWNLFLPDERWGAGLSNLEYAPLAELTGRSIEIAPEALNCAAPDTGNMEVLAMFGTPEQQERWLVPLLEGEIRSCFGDDRARGRVAATRRTWRRRSSATATSTSINGRKWWSTGAMDARCKVAIVMGVTNPDGPRYAQHSMILVPLDAPGVRIERDLTVFGYHDQHGHAEISFEDVRVPAANLIGQEGGGFAIAQARLGPGRIHHCMRLIGLSERALELMVDRVASRVAFGRPLAAQGVIREWIAESRIEIEQARLLVLKAAWIMDTAGNKHAQSEIAAIKVVAARLACRVTDRAIQALRRRGRVRRLPARRDVRRSAHAAARRRPGRGAPARRRAARAGAARGRRGAGRPRPPDALRFTAARTGAGVR